MSTPTDVAGKTDETGNEPSGSSIGFTATLVLLVGTALLLTATCVVAVVASLLVGWWLL